MVDGVPVLLAKPQTYMNLSGESVSVLGVCPSSAVYCSIVAYFVSFTDFLWYGALILLMQLSTIRSFTSYVLNSGYHVNITMPVLFNDNILGVCMQNFL